MPPYLNFALDLSTQPDGQYCITAKSPVGEVSVIVANPFTQAEIDEIIAVLAGAAPNVTRAQAAQMARTFGQRLFQFLIRGNDDINAAYFASLDRAGRDGLRIRLTTERAGVLADLPYELLNDPNRDYLALSRGTPVVRYPQQLNIRPRVPVTLPIRILVIIAAPADFPALDVEGEWARLQQATADLQARGLVTLERLDHAALIHLQRRLRMLEYHVVHFIGHSAFDAAAQQGMLVMENESDPTRAQLVGGAALGREIGEESAVRLVVLNSCQSASRPRHDAFAGIASGLVARGVPAVVAMQFPITDAAAGVFAEEFYRALAESLPIDAALSEARRAIANRVHNNEWATPVLYMRLDDSALFRTSAEPTVQRVSPVAARRPMALPMRLALSVLIVVVVVLVIGALRQGLFTPPPPTETPPAEATDDPTAPDLQIASIRSSPSRPAPGQAFRLLISIRNAGQRESGSFNWTWDASPVLRDALEGRVDNIAPGASKNISFPYSYGWWGSYSSQIVIDADSEIRELDERNNREPATLELDATSPFEIDFSLLPNNEIVVPPFGVSAESFLDWNMVFTNETPDCNQYAILDLNGDSVLTLADEAPATCVDVPFVLLLEGSAPINRPVNNIALELMPNASGTATVSLFSDREGEALVFQTPSIPVQANLPIEISTTNPNPQRIRRVVLALPGQRARLTGLTLFPLVE